MDVRYSDKKETNKKILKNVFKNDDSYFNTGDLMRRDKLGFFYWSDRVGDTYRWKGENVSTTEVSQVITRCGGVQLLEVAVYGVAVPGFDGLKIIILFFFIFFYCIIYI